MGLCGRVVGTDESKTMSLIRSKRSWAKEREKWEIIKRKSFDAIEGDTRIADDDRVG